MFRLEGKHLGDRASLEARLARAMETLWIAYQPIVSWSRRTAFAYEALVRNEEPTLRSPPDLFEAAERLGRLQELGRAVRDHVARTLDEQPIDGAAVHQPARDGAGRRFVDLGGGAAVAPRRAGGPGGHRARAAGEDPRRHGARRAAARARLPHRGRRSGRRLRRADQLRAPRARGGQGRHVPDPGHRSLADEAEAAAFDRVAVPRARHRDHRRRDRDRSRARRADRAWAATSARATCSPAPTSPGPRSSSDLPLPLAGEGRGEGKPPEVALAGTHRARVRFRAWTSS